VHKDKVLKSWITSVRLIDEVRTVETKHHHELIEETLDRQAKHQNTKTDTLCGPSCHGNTSQSNAVSSILSSATNFVKLPPLTDTEHTLLHKHNGCTKCCHFYMDHHSQSCPNGFLLGKGYKTLTVTDALSAKKGKAVAKLIAKPITATSSTIESINSDNEISATATILPDSPGEYTSDSDEDWDVSCHKVSGLLHHSKHLIWNCQIHSLTDDFPVKMHALIDNSTHITLICPELVDSLGLKKYCLHKLEIVDVAFSKENKKTELYHYVKLSLSSLDCAWTSHIVKALVTPGLCTPVILGLPWLEQNTIVTDHATCTCIDKMKLYDLLNPPLIVPPLPPKPKLHEQIKITKVDKKLVLAELMMVVSDQLKNAKLKPEQVKDFNVTGAVCQRLDVLITQEQLAKKEKKLKTDFQEIFEPIPHAEELPQDVVAEIHIKNTEKTIKSCSYPSPQKYKQAWQILIQQHLDTSQICPSSSLCASPAFIVPKSNPNMLP